MKDKTPEQAKKRFLFISFDQTNLSLKKNDLVIENTRNDLPFGLGMDEP